MLESVCDKDEAIVHSSFLLCQKESGFPWSAMNILHCSPLSVLGATYTSALCLTRLVDVRLCSCATCIVQIRFVTGGSSCARSMSMLALMGKAAGEPSSGAHGGSKGSSKGNGKASTGHESEIVSRSSTLCISMDRILQALEDRSSHVCVIKGESLKKEVLTLSTAWKEDEKARREEHEADKTNPLRNHVLKGHFRSVVAKLLFELLQIEAEARMNQAATSYLASLDIASLDAAISVRDQGTLSLKRTGHGCGPS